MNKISLFLFTVLLFLGASRGLNPYGKEEFFLTGPRSFRNLYPEGPVEILLVDSFYMGVVFKTYFHKYRIVYGYQKHKEVVARIPKSYWTKYRPYFGMSIFRRPELFAPEFTPMPPGMVFIGDPTFGRWVKQRKGRKGKRVWQFNQLGRAFPKTLGWGDFAPTLNFYETAKIYQSKKQPFFGKNQEFGLEGSVSVASFGSLVDEEPTKPFELVTYFLKGFKFPTRKR